MRRFILFFAILFCTKALVSASNDSLRTRKGALSISTGLFSAGTLITLQQAWYADYNTGRFHIFNDNHEWFQMDKAGHVYSTYQSARLLMEACNWAGFNRKTRYMLGAGAGFVFMTGIEILDGYSRGWGYSWGDQLSNFIGTGMAVAQDLLWEDQRLQLKLSYAPSGLAKYNPALLGRNFQEQLLKDYNGQTYWLSINPASFFTKEKSLRTALSIAIGYSARGMLGAVNNNKAALQPDGTLIAVQRERLCLLSLDLDLRKLPIRSRFVKSILSVVQIVKIPAPTLQFSRRGIRAYGIYF
jgi:hypothetical protein